MAIEIRDAILADESNWRGLWAAYLTFYKVDVAPCVTNTTWKRIMDPASPINMRVALIENKVVGFAIYLNHPSTWVENEDCYLEDLFIDETLRGQGIGRALIDNLMALGREKGWERIYWHTDENNIRARRLYDSYTKTDGHVRYRIRLNA
jgi:ribosomal protein S18 acetylase RimI-like enzyme